MNPENIKLSEEVILQCKELNREILNKIYNFIDDKSDEETFYILSLIIKNTILFWLSGVEATNEVQTKCYVLRGLCDAIEEFIERQYLEDINANPVNSHETKNEK